MTMRTTTLFNHVRSEMIKKGHNEFIDDEGNLVLFDDDYQFMQKIFRYDPDIADIISELFNQMSLSDRSFDRHFKRNFTFRFINRQINRQTIEAFKLQLMSTFMENESFINTIYNELDDYILQKTTSKGENNQSNKQTNEGTTNTDNRSAYADLPQDQANLDVNNTTMNYATDNTVSRNKQSNTSESDSLTTGDNLTESESYKLDELFKTMGLHEKIFNIFDKKCFLQIW